MFWLKNKAGWKDRQDVDVTSKGDKINPTILVDASETALALKKLKEEFNKQA